MKAAQLVKYGEGIKINSEVARPEPGEGQVLVEVAAAGVNPFDIKIRDGAVSLPEGVSMPATLGGDLAGVVVELGPGVVGFEIGQAVYGQAGAMSGQGSFAEFAPVKVSQLAPSPSGLEGTTIAALPLVSTSAYQALVDHMDLKPGQKILIHGGAGGIGSIAVQLAKHLGAYVATTVRSADADFVKNLDADEVIDYEKQDFTQTIHDYDAVFDTVGGDTNEKSYAVLRRGGTLVSMVAQPNEAKVEEYGINYVSQFTQSTAERLIAVAKLVENKAIKVKIDKIFSLDQAAEALEYLKSGHPQGKVVIRVK